MTKHAVIIGAGFGGMAAALRLKAKGYAVTVFDRMPMLGGRAQVLKKEGFIYDAGPTVITAPFLFEELFALFNKKCADYITFKPVSPWYQFYFADIGKTFSYSNTLEETLAEIAKFNPEDRQGYKDLLAMSEKIFALGFTQLGDKPFSHFTDMVKLLPKLIQLKSYLNVYQLVASYLKDPYLRKAFSIQPLLVGGNPFDTTSIYNLIHYLEHQWGISFPMGGMGALVAALGKLMQEENINIQLNQTVDRINTNNKQQVTGVTLANANIINADIVIANVDPPHLYKNMLSQPLKSLNHLHYSMGLFVIYFATNKQYPNIVHHTIWMGKRYKALLQDIFHKKILAEDFSLYLHRPTATDPSLAPENCDNFYVLSPVPNLQANINWQAQAENYCQKILQALEETLLPDLKKHLIHYFYTTPEDFQSQYLAYHGSGFSIAPILRQSAYFRFHNQSQKIKNLYLVGAGTHPGAGIPGVLTSAKVLEHLL